MLTFRREITHGEVGMAPPRFVRILDQWNLMPVELLA